MFTNRELKKLLIPLVIEQLLVMLVGTMDTMMVSHVGEYAVSAVALVDMIDYLIITIMSALATGGAVIVNQYLGRSDDKNASVTAGQLVSVTTVIATLIMMIGLLFHRQILRLLFGKIDADVMHACVVYFMITALSFPFLGIYNAGAALCRSMQKTNITMYISALMNIINVAGNAIGIFYFKGGVMSVALPTLLSRMIAAVMITALLFHEEYRIHYTWENILFLNKKYVKSILSMAVPNSIENGLFALGRVLVSGIVALFGTVQIAAYGVANSIFPIAVLVVNAVNLAMITIVGQCIGSGKYQQSVYYTKKLMKLSYASTAVLGVIICLLLPLLPYVYELSDEAYQYVCILIIMHNVLSVFLHPTSFNLANSLRAAGDVKFTMLVGIGSMLLFRIGAGILFGIVLKLGVIGVCIAMGLDWLARSIAFIFRYRSGKWKGIIVIS